MQGWLTPDLALFSNPPEQRVVSVPGDLWYLVSGALGQLSLEENWEGYGDATPEETAEFFNDMYEEFLMSRLHYIGELRAFVGSSLPDDWIAMDGVSRLVADYPELAAVIPSGWISGANFTLPMMAGRVPVGEGMDTLFTFVRGAIGGERQHILTTTEMPSHTHQYAMHTQSVTGANGTVLKPNPTGQSLTTAATGGGLPHQNMPPYLVVRWAIFGG